MNRNNENEIQQEDGKFTCTLCYERLDGNHESKKHFIKEHKKDMKQTITGNKCEYVFCMDIELNKCSQFCNYYKKKHARSIKGRSKREGLIRGGCDCTGDSWDTSGGFVLSIVYIVLWKCTTNK